MFQNIVHVLYPFGNNAKRLAHLGNIDKLCGPQIAKTGISIVTHVVRLCFEKFGQRIIRAFAGLGFTLSNALGEDLLEFSV